MKNIQYYEDNSPNLRETLNSVSLHWSKDQVIRFLYKNLANFVQRDLQYFLQDDEEKLRQYSNGFIDRFPNIVCYSLAEFYCTVFNEFDIEANVVQSNTAKIPLFGVVVKGDLGDYYLHPLEDLFLNQYGLKPKAFGYVPKFRTINDSCPNLVRLSDEYISDLDDSLDFTFLDDYFQYLKSEMKIFDNACSFLNIDEPLHNKDIREEKLDFFSNNLINIGNVNGFFERALLYQYLNDTLLNKREKRYVKVLIEDGLSDNPFITYNILRSDETISYREEKSSSGYVLTKQNKFTKSNMS